MNAWDALNATNFVCPSLGNDVLDRFLQKSLQAAGIIDIHGASGSGKSSFALQLAVHTLSQNKDSYALYICTEGSFCVERMNQILEFFPFEHTRGDIRNRIIVQHLGDLESQEHYILYFLPFFVENINVKLIIIDSISANFRLSEKTMEISRSLYQMAATLNRISFQQSCIIITLSQVSDVFQAGSDTDLSSCVRPALGLTWMNSVTTSIRLSRINLCSSERRLSILRCPVQAISSIICSLVQSGFQA